MRPHLSINVKDIAKSVEFYTKAFGVKPQKFIGTYAKFDLKSPSFNFSMHESVEGRRASQVNHLGVEVDSVDEVKTWQKRFEDLKIPVLVEDQTDCCYALQDKFWFRDPDGNNWEVFFVHEQLANVGAEPPRKKKVAKGAACDTDSGCC
ncbi:MAG: VOC family protein [Deltaproteobacteria bacterium]|nr:VOC family protein [Deltaproteobacteria bacterium]